MTAVLLGPALLALGASPFQTCSIRNCFSFCLFFLSILFFLMYVYMFMYAGMYEGQG